MKVFKHPTRPRHRQTGFSLIEIMVVIVIIAIMASMIVPRIMGKPDEARVTKAITDIRQLEGALNMYRLDNYAYPSTDQGLQALVQRPSGTPEPRNYQQGGYIQRLPDDPWGNPYQYLNPGQHSEIDIWSLGADGAPGGEGINTDIGNWNMNEVQGGQ